MYYFWQRTEKRMTGDFVVCAQYVVVGWLLRLMFHYFIIISFLGKENWSIVISTLIRLHRRKQPIHSRTLGPSFNPAPAPPKYLLSPNIHPIIPPSIPSSSCLDTEIYPARPTPSACASSSIPCPDCIPTTTCTPMPRNYATS